MTARQPRGLVRVNGQAVPWASWEVDNNTFYAADTFRVVLPVSALPKGFGVSYFATTTSLSVEVLVGFPRDPESFTARDLTSLIVGDADEVSYSPDGFTIELNGRDATAKLIDTKTSEKYPNLTASQIVTKLAAKYGLTPVVTATASKVGRYYQIDHVREQNERTEWDLLTWLAREEKFVCFVKGRELHFQPETKADAKPYVIRWTPATADRSAQSDAQRLTFTRQMTVAKDVSVTVKSWNSKQKKSFDRKATRTKSGGKHVQQYSYTVAGLTPEQAQQRANQLLSEISKHEVKLSVDGPADNVLQGTDLIAIKGTGTAFDQIYYPDTITRSMDIGEGYRWRIEAKNHSPESEPTI